MALAGTITVHNATWIVQDRCDGTLVEVGRGSATVSDPVRHRTRHVNGGQSYRVPANFIGLASRKGQPR